MSTIGTLSEAPVTQSAEAVVSLLKYIGKPFDPLPEAVLLQDLVLVLSSRKDVFYTTTAKSCSCPSAAYRPGQKCKHQRRYYPGSDVAKEVAKDDTGSIRPSGKWPGGFNGPVDPESIKAKTGPSKMGA